MTGSHYGNLFSITTFGESHGPGLGVILDGCPAGLFLDQAFLQSYLDRRKPGQTPFASARKEPDTVSVLSGIFENQTTGAPLFLFVKNEQSDSSPYEAYRSCYRPGHADFSWDARFQHRDYRGGGRSSGRETVARVAAGAVAIQILKELNITVTAYTESIGPICVPKESLHLDDCPKNPLWMPDHSTAKKAAQYLKEQMEQGDSVGGTIACTISGLPAGIGAPVFEKLDANLAKAIFSIGAVKGFEIGSGFHGATLSGSVQNDSWYYDTSGCLQKESNYAGGILGGMSDGSPIFLRAAIKPTPSISKPQKTITTEQKNTTISIHGQHDPTIVPRAVVVVESMVAITLVDALFCSMSTQLQKIKHFFCNPS